VNREFFLHLQLEVKLPRQSSVAIVKEAAQSSFVIIFNLITTPHLKPKFLKHNPFFTIST